MKITNINAVDIPDAWFQCVASILENGFKYEIEHGSYIGQTRLEFDQVTILINHPYQEPYDLMLPQIPAAFNIPNPVANGYVEQYLPYLMTDHIEPGEQYCYDDQTEVLTKNGWQRFDTLANRDFVATLDPVTHVLNYQPIVNIHRSLYTGPMYHFKTTQIDQMVSPNHTMYIKDSKQDSQFEIKKAKDIEYNRFFIKKDCVWEGEEKEYFTLPAVDYGNTRYKDFGKERKIPMDVWLEFFGTWLADGSIRKYKNAYSIVVTKCNKPKWCEELLEQIFNSVNYHKKDFVVNDKQIHAYLKQFGLAGDKYIPRDILMLSSRQLEILFTAMYRCDGTKNTKRDFYKYSTKSLRLANDVQELSLKINLCGNIREDSGIYRINIGAIGANYMNNTTPGIRNKQIYEKDYEGTIFCVEVKKHHIIYVRRKGTPCWSGNTYGSRIYDQVKHFTRLLKSTPNTNQAVLQVGHPSDFLLDDPPCLRHIDMRIKDDKLIFYPYFRSWDLWGGFPANLAGIAVLQKSMADEIGVLSGPICASSKGLHIYGYVEELAKLRCNK